jgi:ABC-type transport system involved in multi-copper enzyme maturation permease subunit
MLSALKRIAAIARLVLIDGLRRHALMGLIVLSMAAQAGALLFFDFIPRDIGRASSDFILSLAWLSGCIFLFFHGVQVIALDEERKVIYSLLARPISRGEYVLGIFTGLAGLLLLLNLLLCGLGFCTLLIIKQLVPSVYFSQFHIVPYLLAWFGLIAMELMLLSVILLFSGLVRGSFPVLLISLSFYAICSGLPVAREAVSQQAARAEGLTGLKTMLLWMTAVFPDFDRLDFKNMIASSAPLPDISLLLVNFGLTISYLGLFLWLACLVYQRRDLQ